MLGSQEKGDLERGKGKGEMEMQDGKRRDVARGGLERGVLGRVISSAL